MDNERNNKVNSMDNLSDLDMERMIMAGSTDMVVFDLDGTLADIEPYLHFLVEHPDSPRDWYGFHQSVYGATPKADVLAMYSLYAMRDIEVVILTSRQRDWEDVSSDWLWKWGVDYDRLIMRGMKDKRSAPEYKREELMNLMSEGFNIVHVFDDHPGVIKVCEGLGLPNTKVPGYEEASAMMEDLANSEKWKVSA